MRPLRVHRLSEAEESQVEREIRNIERFPIRAKRGACWEEQAMRHAILVHAGEIAELGDRLAGLVDDDDLVRLVGRGPDIVMRVDDDAIGAVDAVDEDAWRPRRAILIDG